MVAPLIVKLILFSVAKKVTVYLVARLYGFPRLYRRAAKINRYLNGNNPKRRRFVTNGLQTMFRLPRYISQRFQRWWGVPEPPQAPPGHLSSSQSSSGGASALRKGQVRHIHTSSGASRSSAIAHCQLPASRLSPVNWLICSHLSGLRRENRGSMMREQSSRSNFSASFLPFCAQGFLTIATATGKGDGKQLQICLVDCQCPVHHGNLLVHRPSVFHASCRKNGQLGGGFEEGTIDLRWPGCHMMRSNLRVSRDSELSTQSKLCSGADNLSPSSCLPMEAGGLQLLLR